MRLHPARAVGLLRAPWIPGWSKDPLWRRARAVPSLDLRFAENKSLVDATSGANLVTFTRASEATFVNSQGQIQTAAIDAPRFDHDPSTGESLGLLVEEQRKNEIRNNTMVGAVAGTPGTLPTNWSSSLAGLTQQIVGTGIDKGVSYIDIRLSGTTTGAQASVNFGNNTEAICSNGQAWASSIYASVVAGSTANVSQLFFNNNVWGSGGTVYLTELAGIPNFLGQLTSSLIRFTGAATINNASATSLRPYISLLFNVGAAIDITLRIGLPQLEQGAFATSVIPTSGTAATRAADVARITTLGANVRSLFSQFRSPASGTRPIVSLDDNTANERIELLTSGTDPKFLVTDGGVAQADLDAGTITANTTARLAARFITNDFAASVSGGASATDASGTMPTVDRIRIGRDQAGNYLNGHIARLAGWDSSLELLSSITQ